MGVAVSTESSLVSHHRVAIEKKIIVTGEGHGNGTVEGHFQSSSKERRDC